MSPGFAKEMARPKTEMTTIITPFWDIGLELD